MVVVVVVDTVVVGDVGVCIGVVWKMLTWLLW